MKTWFFYLIFSVSCAASYSDQALAFGISSGEGCCTALTDENLSRVADAYGVPGRLTDHILNNILSDYSDQDLRMIQTMPGEACKTRPDDLCEVMPDEFFRFLVEEEQARRANAAWVIQSTWDWVRTIILFGLSIIGAVLGVLNYYNQRNELSKHST